MLVLSREPQQVVELTTAGGEVITIRYLDRVDNRIRLGFEAPMSVQIVRTEAKHKTPCREKHGPPVA